MEQYTGGAVVKNPPPNAGDLRDSGLIPGWERSPGKQNGNSLQYPCLDRGAWRATAHVIAESDTTEHTPPPPHKIYN